MKGGVRLCFLIFLLLEALCSEGCRKEEREALLGLRYHFDYAIWNVHTDCCEWEGVHCNSSTGRVAQLYLYGSWWPLDKQYINYSDFSVFKDLKELHLSGSYIVGCVEGEELPNLELLDISDNLKLDTAAGILSCLDGLPSLKSLSLRYNSFNTSSLTHVFESVSPKLRSNLEVLDISGNDLSNDILASLEGFTSLKELYLAQTQMDSDLNFQALCSSFKNLEILDLSGNNFNHTDIGSALTGLSSLNSLYLGYTQLTWRSIYKNETFKWPTNLKELDLRSNSLSNRFVSSMRGLPHLRFLYLSNNQLEEALDISYNETFKWPTTLQELHLDFNRLTNKSLSSLSDLPHLQYLDLSYNQLEGALHINDNETFKWPTNLQELYLYNNRLTGKSLSFLSDLPHLQYLDLSNNQLEGASDMSGNETFKWPTNLQELHLEYNSLSNKSLSSVSDLPHLQFLYLRDNQLEGTLDISGPSLADFRPG